MIILYTFVILIIYLLVGFLFAAILIRCNQWQISDEIIELEDIVSGWPVILLFYIGKLFEPLFKKIAGIK